MSDCGKYIEMISLMVDGELNEEQEAELRTHIESCDECKRVYDAFAGISGALAEDLAEPPEMLAVSVMHKIRQKNHGVNNSRFYFGRFTAVAACFAVVMFSAFHFGLFDGAGSKTAMSAAAPQAVETQNSTLSDKSTGTADTYSAAVPESTNDGIALAKGKSVAGSEPNPEPSEGGAGANASMPDTQQTLTAGTPDNGNSDSGTMQYGFPSPKMAMATREGSAETNKEPASLFETAELALYAGKYSSTETDKNKLLVTVSDKDKLSSLTGLLTAVADDEANYADTDSKFTEEDPSYTVFVPANKDIDASATDKIIGVWFVDGETWCVLEAASVDDGSTDTVKILYKAVGLQENLESQIKQLEASN